MSRSYGRTLLAWAILALPLLCNVYARRILAPVEIIGGIAHIILFIVFVTTLCVMARRSTAEFVFTETITGISGWKNSGVQWCIGLLAGAFPLGCKCHPRTISTSIRSEWANHQFSF